VRALLHSFHDLSIRHKLFFSYFFLVLFFLCLFLAINTVLATRENEAQALRSARMVFGQTRAYLQDRTESIRNLLYLVATNSSVQELFDRRASYYREEIGRWPIDAQSLEKILYPTTINPDISSIHFYMKYGLASVFQNDRYIPLSEVSGTEWYRRLVENSRRTWWYMDDSSPPAGEARFVHAVRGVFASQNVNELTGVIRFDVPEEVLRGTLGNAVLTESTAALLIDSMGRVVSAAGSVSADRDRALRQSLRDGDLAAESWRTMSLGGAQYLAGTQAIANSDWVLVLLLPYRDIVRMSARPIRQMLVVFLLIIPLTLLFAFLVSRSATRRIQNLIGKMHRVVSGDFTVALNPQNRDEIGQLTESFNLMVSEIEQLAGEKYRLGKEVKNLELKALQAQINPHFLYNTLDLINWMSMKHGAHEIRALVNALSRFYKLSLSRGEDTVTVRDEVEHARTYIQIQNMRYDDSIGFVVELPDDLLACPILKLVMQPLVENAIFHGIMAKKDERGTIRITGERDGGAVRLFVEDDGWGMPQEEARQVLCGRAGADDHHGYGVRNIHERLRLSYGAGYGLAFHSREGHGTRVTITIPAGTSD
jgi:two-component system sensor histidine kinase YesM